MRMPEWRMCLIALAWRAHPDYELVVAANRDEFHDRPAAPADFWENAPGIFGGRDLKQGGGWLALHDSGRLAAITNVRRMIPPDPKSPSRGALVTQFLSSNKSAESFSLTLGHRAGDYAGFNLLLFDGHHLSYCTNSDSFQSHSIEPGVHVLSNASLNTPWPKTLRLRRAMQAFINQRVASRKLLFTALGDCEQAADAELPNTGVGPELEKFLSPPFIRGDRYGTRASTVVTIAHDGRAEFIERRFGANGVFESESRACLQLPPRRIH